jgi:hypothetical protein
MYRGHLEWQHLPTKFHENPPIGSNFISGGHTNRHTHTHTYTQTDRQAGDIISPLSFFESRLKISYDNILSHSLSIIRTHIYTYICTHTHIYIYSI